MDDVKSSLIDLLINNEEEAIKKLDQVLSMNSRKRDIFYMLRMRYKDIKEKSLAGVISSNEKNLEVNKIRHSLLSIIKDLEPDDFALNSSHLKKIFDYKKDTTGKTVSKNVDDFVIKLDSISKSHFGIMVYYKNWRRLIEWRRVTGKFEEKVYVDGKEVTEVEGFEHFVKDLSKALTIGLIVIATVIV